MKTAKVPEILALYADAGVRRYKCATTREADVLAGVLAQEKVPGGDILLAHHLFGPGLARLAQIAAEYPGVRFSTLVEAASQIDAIPGEIGVFIDLDLGMARTGLDAARADDVAEIARRAGPRLRGLHAYDGHRVEADEASRAALVHADYDGLVRLVKDLRGKGHEVPEIVTAGTPAFPAALRHAGLATLEGTVHRVSPGTVVYHDLRSVAQIPAVRAEWAATVLTRVSSHPGTDLFTCDAGSKAIEGAGSGPIASVLGHPEFEALRQSEEHTVFRAPPDARPARGAVLRLVPGHVCPTVNLAEQAVLVDDGCFAGIVEVRARAHESLRLEE